MAVAWRRLADVPADDARPWLYATARNLLHAEWRQRQRLSSLRASDTDVSTAPVEWDELEPRLAAAQQALPAIDRDALLLVAWEDLTPALAARSLGIREVTFRVRLHRARRRFEAALATPTATHRGLTHVPETEDR